MQNGIPSLIWADLAVPNSPVGSIPYVANDSVSIATDILNFFYQNGSAPVPVVGNVALLGILPLQLTIANGLRKAYTDTTAVPGAATINKTCGRIKIAAGQIIATITSNCCTATSIINVQLEGGADATAKGVNVTARDGNFDIILTAACTAAVVVTFNITSVY